MPSRAQAATKPIKGSALGAANVNKATITAIPARQTWLSLSGSFSNQNEWIQNKTRKWQVLLQINSSDLCWTTWSDLLSIPCPGHKRVKHGKHISPSPSAVKAPWLTSAMSLGMTCCNPQGRWYSRHSRRWSIHSAMKKVPSARSTPSGRSRAGSLCARYWWADWEGFPACKSMLPKSGPEQRKASMPPGSSRQISTKVWQCQPLGWCWEGDTSVPQQRCLPKWRWLPKWQRHIQLV